LFTAATDRELRKRAFYSLYTMDRLLSAEFGIPIMLSDSDIDTCLPGDDDRHDEVEMDDIHPARTPVDQHQDTVDSSVPAKRKREDGEAASALPASSATGSQPSLTELGPAILAPDHNVPAARIRLLAANALIRMARMVGRAMELFNKSLKHRSLDREYRIRVSKLMFSTGSLETAHRPG
jgi:hypothetical protein